MSEKYQFVAPTWPMWPGTDANQRLRRIAVESARQTNAMPTVKAGRILRHQPSRGPATKR